MKEIEFKIFKTLYVMFVGIWDLISNVKHFNLWFTNSGKELKILISIFDLQILVKN